MRHAGFVRLFTSWVMLVCAAAAVQANAAAPFVIALPNGYYIQRDRSSQLRVLNRHGHAVVGPVAGYTVRGFIVAGLVGPEPENHGAYINESPLPESPESLYFVLDTRTGHLDERLSLQAWKEKLAALGLSQAPEIRAPLLPT